VTLPPFRTPYPTHALEPYLGEEAVDLHFKLTAGYIKRANKLYRAQAAGKFVDRQRLAFEVAGATLHKIWWENITPLAPGRKRTVNRKILETFGSDAVGRSAATLKRELVIAGTAVAGSGWAALVWCKHKKRAEVITFPNHSFPWNHYEPLLLLDVWEHSYVCEYGGDRKGYLKELLKLVDWSVVASRLP
jgi:Fe-Mn family superoxide dismutase